MIIHKVIIYTVVCNKVNVFNSAQLHPSYYPYWLRTLYYDYDGIATRYHGRTTNSTMSVLLWQAFSDYNA